MSTCEDYVFVCPECDQSIRVNPSMREALVENGCVICGTAITQDAFDSQNDES